MITDEKNSSNEPIKFLLMQDAVATEKNFIRRTNTGMSPEAIQKKQGWQIGHTIYERSRFAAA